MILRASACLFVLVACDPPTSGPAPENLPRVASGADASPGMKPRMSEHFRDAAAIKDAVIAGELADTRAPARRLRDDPDEHPAAWRPFIEANAAHADAVLAARNRRDAGAAAGGLARTCGDCHAALGAGPRFEPPHDVPSAEPRDPRVRMQRHQWAADRMWEALIGRSEYAWMAGAAALAVPPLDREALTRDAELADEVLELNEQVQALGAQAGATVGWEARGRLYGEFLATCAGCHQGGC